MRHWNRNSWDDLRRIILLEEISDALLADIAAAATYRKHGRNALISGPGYVCPDVCLIHAGAVRCSRSSEAGKQIQVTVYGAGDSYGLHHVTSCSDDESSAAAGTDGAAVYHVDGHHFRALLARDPNLALRVIDELAYRLRSAHARIEILGLYDVRGRVHRQLAVLTEASPDRTVTVTQQELAAMIGASREEVSRAIQELRRGGLLKQGTTPGTLTLTIPLLSPST
jgi:CRP/FNR family transcriptional regulator, cyclic AMP receptor protein